MKLNLILNKKGEISLYTVQASFILLVVAMLAVQVYHPIANAFLFDSAFFASGTIPRLLIDLVPWAPILGIFYLLFKQG